MGEEKEKGVDWLKVDGLFGVDPTLGVDCEKTLPLFEGPNENEVGVFTGAGACPKENPLTAGVVVGTASADFWPKEKPEEDVFWPKPLNPRPLLSCFSD